MLTIKSFRQVSTFGRDTIRRFRKNVSELKRFAARDFEDVLQVGTVSPVFFLPTDASPAVFDPGICRTTTRASQLKCYPPALCPLPLARTCEASSSYR